MFISSTGQRFLRCMASVLLYTLFILTGCESCVDSSREQNNTTIKPQLTSSCNQTPECELNTYTCEDQQTVNRCVEDVNGCAVWSNVEQCETGTKCHQGGCYTEQEISCPGSCIIGQNYCDPDGAIRICDDFDGDGCGELDPENYTGCDQGQWCYAGTCETSVSLPPVPTALEAGSRFQSIFHRGETTHPVDDSVVILPYDAFMAAIQGRYFGDIPSPSRNASEHVDTNENGIDDTVDLAIQVAMNGNDINTLGIHAEVEDLGTSGSFEGDVFLVLMDPVLVDDNKGLVNTSGSYREIESKRYFIAIAHGLSGQTNWKAKTGTMIAMDPQSSGFSNSCCGAQTPERMCGGADPDGSPFGPRRCGGGSLSLLDCPPLAQDITDALRQPPNNIFVIEPTEEPFRAGLEKTTQPDPEQLTTVIETRGNGMPAVVLYPFKERSFHDLNKAWNSDDPSSVYAAAGWLDASVLNIIDESPAGLLCEYCSKALCGEGGTPGKVGIGSEPWGTQVGDCGESANWVSPVCQQAGKGLSLSDTCGGVCEGCFGYDRNHAQGSLGSCGGFMGNTAASAQLVSSTVSCVGPRVPEFCKYSSDNDACTCDEDCQLIKAELWAAAVGCGGGGTSSNPNITCCGDGSSPCACVRTGEVSTCQTCNSNGDCRTFGVKHDGTFLTPDGEPEEAFRNQEECEQKHPAGCKNGSNNGWAVWVPGMDDSPDDSGVKQEPIEKTKSGDSEETKDMVPAKKAEDKKTVKDKLEDLNNALANAVGPVLDSKLASVSSEKKEVASNTTEVEEETKSLSEIASELGDQSVEKAKSSMNHLEKGFASLARKFDESNLDNEAAETAADPVELFSGSLALSQRDLSYKGAVRPLTFSRHYTSSSDTRSILGSNWSHNFNVRVEPVKRDTAPEWVPSYCIEHAPITTCALVHGANHSKRLFILDPASDQLHNVHMFMPQAGDGSTLYMEEDLWVLRSMQGHIRVFNEYGYMIEDRDRFGNGFEISYEPTPAFHLYSRWCRALGDSERYFKQQNFDARVCVLLGWLVGERAEPQIPQEGYSVLLENSTSSIPNIHIPAESMLVDFQHSSVEELTGLVYKSKDPSEWIEKDIQYAKALIASGPLPLVPTGTLRMRPVKVRDDLGRELTFEYFDDELQTTTYGLLKRVSGPLSTSVTYTYDRPSQMDASSELARLNESFLTQVNRQDAPLAHESVIPAPATVVEFKYNWPEYGPSFDSSTNGTPHRQTIYDAYLAFFKTSYGCILAQEDYAHVCSNSSSAPDLSQVCTAAGSVYVGGDSLPSTGGTCAGAPLAGDQHMPGNPLQLAMIEEHNYVSDVADNIVQVTVNGTIESESRYGIDPSADDFEKITVQRYGGVDLYDAASYQNQARAQQNSNLGNQWDSSFPAYRFEYLQTGPSEFSVEAKDVTDSTNFLPGDLKQRFPLEPKPADQDAVSYCEAQGGQFCVERKLSPDQEKSFQGDPSNFSFSPFTCSLNDRAPAYRNLPSWRYALKYFELDEPSLPEGATKPIYRSRLSCSRMMSAQMSRASHNGLLHHPVQINEKTYWNILAGDRDEIEDNMRRTCAWVKLTNRTGSEMYYGLNYRGLTNVQAQRNAEDTAWIITEYIYNADGHLLEMRNPTEGATAWSRDQGLTEFEYSSPQPEADDGMVKWEPFWWTRRFNRLIHRVVPSLHNDQPAYAHQVTSSRVLEGTEIEAVETRYTYEPLFNQVHRIETWLKSAASDVHQTTTIYDFDYQEYDPNSQAFCDALAGFRRWGLELFYPTTQDADGNTTILRQCDGAYLEYLFPQHFYDANINGDDGFSLKLANSVDNVEGIGFPNHTLIPVHHIKGVPVRVTSINHENDTQYTTFMTYAPSGQLASVYSADRGFAHFEYYPYNSDNSRSPTQVFGDSNADTFVSSSQYKGLLASVSVKHFDFQYEVEDGPSLPTCDAFGGPFQWFIPGGCSDLADATQKLDQLGLPIEARDLLLNLQNEDATTHWGTTHFVYNELGHPSHVSVDGKTSSYIYDSIGRVASLTDPVGNVTTYVRNSRGWIVEESSQGAGGEFLGRSQRQYDAEGNILTSCVDVVDGACQSVINMNMEPVTALQQAVAFNAPLQQQGENPALLISTMRYSPEGQLYQSMGSDGVVSTTYYTPRGLVQKRTLEASVVGGVALPMREEEWTYDHRANRTGKTYRSSQAGEPEFTETFYYDGLDREIGAKDVRGTYYYTAYDASSRVVASKQDSVNQFYTDQPWSPASTGQEKLTSFHTKDGQGRPQVVTSHQDLLTRFTINSRGEVMSVQSTGQEPTWYMRDGHGNVVVTIDPAGNRTLHLSDDDLHQDSLRMSDTGLPTSYVITLAMDSQATQPFVPGSTEILSTTLKHVADAMGRPVLSTIYGKNVGGDLLEATTLYETSPQGFVTAVTNPEGVRSTTSYNVLGWPLVSEIPAPGGGTDRTELTYDHRGLTTQVIDPKGEVTRREYDGFGRLRQSYLPHDPVSAHELLVYDGLGRLKEQLRRPGKPEEEKQTYEYDSRGDLTGVFWETQNLQGAIESLPLQSFEYDDLGRLTGQRDYNAGLQRMGYPNTVINTMYSYDEFGRLIQEGREFADASSPDVAWRTYQSMMSYALVGNAGVDSWESTVTYPDGTSWTESLDRAGRLSSSARALSSHVIDHHWTGGRYRGHDQYYDASVDPWHESRTFDGLGRVTSLSFRAVELDASEQPVQASWGNQYCKGSWDNACAAPIFDVQMKYDVMGRIATSRRQFAHPVEINGQLLPVDSHRQAWQGFDYNAQGHLVQTWNTPGVDEASWNSLVNHQVSTMELQIVGSSGDNWLWDREDHVGSLSSISLASSPSTTRWRHVKSDGSGQSTNRKVGYQLDAVEVDGQTHVMTHDLHGRLTAGMEYEYVYDVQNRLIGIRQPGQNLLEAYFYDASGRLSRVKKDSGEDELFVHFGADIIESYNASTQLKNWEAKWGPGINDLLVWTDSTGVDWLPVVDERHSIVALWNTQQKELTALVEYDEFGRLRVLDDDEMVTCEEGVGVSLCPVLGGDFPFAFNGAWRSSTSGLYNMRHRWYSSRQGQFLTHDPLGTIDSFNMYAFAAFDPINGWDPMGLSTGNPNNDAGGDDHFSTTDHFILALDDLARSVGDFNGGMTQAVEDSVQNSEGTHEYTKASGVAAIAIYKAVTPQNGDDVIGDTIMAVATAGLGKIVKPLKGLFKNSDEAADVVTTTTQVANKSSKKVANQSDDIADGGSAARRQSDSTKKTSCSGGKCTGDGCFIPGTQVLLASGETRAIEQIQIGDEVLVDNPTDTSAPVARRVTQVLTSQTHRVLDIDTSSMDGEVTGHLSPTGEHPFWTLQRGWIKAESLTVGDILITERGEHVYITAIRQRSELSTTYNLVVEGDEESYFVEASPGQFILVDAVDKLASDGQRYLALAPSTWVYAERGMVRASELQPGERVLSLNHQTGAHEYQPINHIGLGVMPAHLQLSLRTLTGEVEELELAHHKKLWVKERGWVQAQLLRVGDALEVLDGEVAYVTSLREVSEPSLSIAFEVDRWHSFLIGEHGVLAHNQSMSELNQWVDAVAVESHKMFASPTNTTGAGLVKSGSNKFTIYVGNAAITREGFAYNQKALMERLKELGLPSNVSIVRSDIISDRSRNMNHAEREIARSAIEEGQELLSIRTVNQKKFGSPVKAMPACTACKDELLKEFPGVEIRSDSGALKTANPLPLDLPDGVCP